MSNIYEHMQKLAFGKVVKSDKQSLNESDLRAKIKELVHSSLGEAKKKKKKEADVAPQNDTVDMDLDIDMDSTEDAPSDTISPETPTNIDIDPKIKSVQDYLQKAYANAKELGDEKLMTQIGNTITMVVRNQVLGGKGDINENEIFNNQYSISDEAYERMNGLVNQHEYYKFINSAAEIMRDLTDDGFETKDVYYYLYTRLLADI